MPMMPCCVFIQSWRRLPNGTAGMFSAGDARRMLTGCPDQPLYSTRTVAESGRLADEFPARIVMASDSTVSAFIFSSQ